MIPEHSLVAWPYANLAKPDRVSWNSHPCVFLVRVATQSSEKRKQSDITLMLGRWVEPAGSPCGCRQCLGRQLLHHPTGSFSFSALRARCVFSSKMKSASLLCNTLLHQCWRGREARQVPPASVDASSSQGFPISLTLHHFSAPPFLPVAPQTEANKPQRERVQPHGHCMSSPRDVQGQSLYQYLRNREHLSIHSGSAFSKTLILLYRYSYLPITY